MTVTQDDVDALTAKARQALLELAGRFHDFGDTAQAMAEEHRPDLGFGQLARRRCSGNECPVDWTLSGGCCRGCSCEAECKSRCGSQCA